jgi:UDP-N-acetylmuramate dehydrogenase
LIDKLGWKGKSLGNAGVHKDQALVLINLGGATGSEVKKLASQISADVRQKFNIDLEPEVNMIG